VRVSSVVLARYYDPATAQFLTVDPDVDTTLSPYGYVAGDPLNDTDPSGDVGAEACVLAEIPIFGEIACGAGVVTEVITDVGAGAAIAGLFARVAPAIVGWALPQPITGGNVSYAKGGQQNIRDTGLAGWSDQQILEALNNPNTPPDQRQRLVKEAKARGLRNVQKRANTSAWVACPGSEQDE